MKNFLLKQTFVLLFLAFSVALHAQFTSSNSMGIFPASQASFDPNLKFTAIGESGGSPGQTVAGCDLYGFRAQFNPNLAVNLGIQTISNIAVERTTGPLDPVPLVTRLPILSFSSQGLTIREQNNTSARGCGTRLAVFNEVSSSNNVFTIFGSATATGGSWNPSDRTLKRNIETIASPMDIINGLTGYTYEYRTDERPELRLPEGLQYGFITQEVQKVMPTAVRQANGVGEELLDFQVMQYDAIVPVLTEALKEQQKTITKLEDRLARLEALLEKQGALDAQPNSLDQFDEIRLGQNRPNPASGNTVIDYSLPSTMTNAFLVVVDVNGREIATQPINDPSGVVELNTSTWASGAYIYSIVSDNRVLARKKMLVK